MKKTVVLFSCIAVLGFASCGEATQEVDQELLESTLQIEEEVDAINLEIEEMNEVEANLDDLENELDNI